jgi:glycosyltransferase involved in cell wall biosynthesis
VQFVPLHRSPLTKALNRCRHLASGRSDFARFRTRRMQAALDATVRAGEFDLVTFSTTMLGWLRLPRGVPIAGDTHNIEFDNLRRAFEETRTPWLRQYFRIQAALTRREEVAFTRRFDTVCVTSERDRGVLQAAAPGGRIVVVPNGVDLDAHQPCQTRREAGAILFTGLMSYYPNAHGVSFFLKEIFPPVLERVPHARVLVVGADPPGALRRLASDRVTVTGYVDDVRPYFARAEAYVVPLRIGGGTRVKALQAMAMGVPIVSTSLGCEGLDVEDGREVLLADTPAAFAGALIRTLQEPALRASLAAHAAERVRQYGWSQVGDRLNHAFTTIPRPAQAPAPRGLTHAADSY